MKVEVSNPANSSMHYGDSPVISSVNAPEKLPSRIIYSGIEARKQFEQMEVDIYNGVRKAKPIEKHKFPNVLKWALGIAGVASAVIFRKDLTKFFRKILKNPFKTSR